MLLTCRACSPFLHKDHYLAAGIKPVAAICCQEEVAREHVRGLLLPLQVCELHLRFGHMASFALHARHAARRHWLGACVDAWDHIEIKGWPQGGRCAAAICWGEVQ